MGVGLIAGFPEVAVALVAVAANLTAFFFDRVPPALSRLAAD